MALQPPILLAALLLFGAGLRFFCLDCGLPDVVYVDAFKFVDAAREMAQSGAWAPRDFQNPGLYTNLLALIYWIGGARSDYWVHLIAQAVSVLFGTGLTLLTWLAARQVCREGGALLAAALTALSAVLVTLSRIPATDSALVFFMTAGVWMLAREKTSARQLIAAGIFAGLAAGTKFSGLYFGLFMLLAIAIVCARARSRVYPWPALAASGAAAAAALIATTPWIAARFMEYYHRFALEMLIQNHGQIGRVQHGFFDYLVSRTITWEQPPLGTSILGNDGILVLIVGLGGCLFGLSFRYGSAVFLHALYVLLYLVLISRPGHLKAVRFLAPILPSFYILTAWALERVSGHGSKTQQMALWGAAWILALAIPAYRSFTYVAMTRGELTERQAARWIREHIPQDAVMLVAPFFLDRLEGRSHKILRLPQAGARQYRETGVAELNAEATPVYYPELLDEVRALGARYIVSQSYYDDAFTDTPENRRWFPRATLAYRGYRERLEREGKLVYETPGQRAHRLGPDVRIYMLPVTVR